MSLRKCFTNYETLSSFRYSCSIDAKRRSYLVVESYPDRPDCSGPSSTERSTFLPQGCSASTGDGEVMDYMESYCTNATAPWDQHGSEYFISE
jgi:hypothetical protein